MNNDFKTVRFNTYREPLYNFKKEKMITHLFGISITIIIFSSLLLGTISYWFPILGFVFIVTLFIYIHRRSKAELYKFSINGLLTIDSLGFHIDQNEKTFIPFDQIKQIKFHYDRPVENYWGRFPPAKTYKLILLLDNKTKEIYVERNAIIGDRIIHGDFVNTMTDLRKISHELYKKIVYDK